MQLRIILLPQKGSHVVMQQMPKTPCIVPQEKNSKKPFKLGFGLPKNWKEIIQINEAVGNATWQDCIKKEVSALMHHEYFDFKSPDYKLSSDYQYYRLHLVYTSRQT